ncbi:DUF6884 domain-containing protein [Paraburkholderia sp. GAS32]|uniref:DUF6884 domain-containing protein n=1 Tax=Paraburkholderia sp. GAS32 TaxID=3035129 RepID=UPI003D260D5C
MTNALLVIACSGRKGDAPAHALDLYRGVMYQSYRANVGQAKPHVIILSALHGFIRGDAVIVPYEQMMSETRAAEITARLQVFDPQAWPRADNVMFAGSGLYRRVMLAALHRQRLGGFRFDLSALHQTTGGIGMQRQQLGQWLRRLDNE